MWYSIEALLRCDEQGDTNVLYDKIIFLIKSEGNEKDVSSKAERMALKFENSYKNHLGNEVTWRLVKILQIQDLAQKNIYDGIEVFSNLMWERDVPKDLRQSSVFSKKKSKQKQEKDN